MTDRVFVDTNVLIYAHDADAGDKQRIAAETLRELWDTRNGVVSAQVLQEFYVNVTRKIVSPLRRSAASEVVRSYGAWTVAIAGVDQILAASELEERHRINFWDALIVATAASAGAATIVSEDFTHGRVIAGVRIENPFAV